MAPSARQWLQAASLGSSDGAFGSLPEYMIRACCKFVLCLRDICMVGLDRIGYRVGMAWYDMVQYITYMCMYLHIYIYDT